MGIFDRKPAHGNWLMQSMELIRAEGYGGLFRGVFNIESGVAGVGATFFPECQACQFQRDYSFTCASCGRNTESFAQFRSGAGDGVYAVLSICNPEAIGQPIGALIVMDNYMVNIKTTMVLEEGAPLFFDLDYRDYLSDDSPGFKLGEIAVDSSLIIGDAGGYSDGSVAYINIPFPPGNYALYLYAQGMFALIIKSEYQTQFDLNPDYLKVVTEGDPKEELTNFALGFEDDLVQSHLNPQGKRAVELNLALTNPWKHELLQDQANPNLDYLTWLMQLWGLSSEEEQGELAETLRPYLLNEDEMKELEAVAALTRGYKRGKR